MKNAFIIAIFSLATALFSVASAANGIPSFGLQSASQFRNKLKSSDFRIPFRRASVTRTADFVVRGANFARFPVLAAQDVQSQLSQVFVRPGGSFVRHYHPRSSEIIYVFKGIFRVLITDEGSNPRIINIVVRTGEATVFPQGLIHQVSCISKRSACGYVAVFTSADPGTVPVPAS